MRPASPPRGPGRGSLPWLVATSALLVATQQGLDASGRMAGLCGTSGLAGAARLAGAALSTFPPGQLAAGWALMVAVMMPPLVSGTINHVATSSLPSRRARAILLTLAAYLGIWIAAGVLLLPVAFALLATAGSAAFPATAALALAWSCSPAALRALNRCHRTSRIGLRGTRADRDCIAQGLRAGLPCVATCWPWMLTAATAGPWHAAAMIGASILLLLDRLAPQPAPAWRLPPWTDFARPAAGR